MPLSSLLRRKKTPAASTPEASPASASAVVEQARTRARRRLIGAVVLLGVGVIAFPLLFETEPRPIPVDLPIEIPKKDGLPPLAMPPAEPAASASAAVVPAPAESPVATPVEPTAAAPGTPVDPARPADAGKATAAAPAPAPAETRPAAPVAEPPAARAAPKTEDGARAQALLEGKASAAPDAGAVRYVVQIGAFASANTVRDVRAKAQKAGLTTYTQVVKVASGEATRVRVGPFGARAEADAAATKARQAGLPATVLKL